MVAVAVWLGTAIGSDGVSTVATFLVGLLHLAVFVGLGFAGGYLAKRNA